MSQLRRALLLATGERYFTLTVSFLTVAVVSRLLRPDEIGISLVGLAVVGFFAAAREFASPNFLIQHQQLSLDEIRKSFSMLLLITLVIAGVLFSSAPWVANLYGDARLTPFLQVLSLSVIFEAAPATIVSLLRREMAFARVALISGSIAVATSTTTVALALAGLSYMSFAWANLVSAGVGAALALALYPDHRIFKPLFRGWRGLLTFGGYNGTNILLHRVYEMLPYLVLGRIVSADAVAFFNRSVMLCQLPDKVFLLGATSVILPAFSEIVRDGRTLKTPYLNAVSLITGIQWPALVVLALLAEPTVGLIFGPQWMTIVPYVQIMAIANLFSFSFQLNYPVFLSVGAVRDSFKRGLIIWPVSALVLTVAAFFGLKAAALSFLFAIPFQAFVSLQFVRKHLDIRWMELAAALRKSLIVTGATAIGPIAVLIVVGDGWNLTVLEALEASVLAGAGWLAGIVFTGHDLLSELQQAAGHLASRLAFIPRAVRAAALQKG
ncbi:oligosaccharide flippase family protein [Hyphomicrobium sp. xq]|uniref:Oligosaccharide flippase family protein n=1 Tax=Hyphomicrobium album TaxID=2665159 RepID=A0A6I3KI06_9HYPH|nr:oligosaccharide flippase family protein [Hyphomicrobium album]MTD94088.1 oligosaccharide flippase family protein [Hyphomicrobium album]